MEDGMVVGIPKNATHEMLKRISTYMAQMEVSGHKSALDNLHYILDSMHNEDRPQYADNAGHLGGYGEPVTDVDTVQGRVNAIQNYRVAASRVKEREME